MTSDGRKAAPLDCLRRRARRARRCRRGGARRRLTGDRRATDPQLSPTQRQIAYFDTVRSHKGVSPYPTTGDVWVVAVDSPRARRLTTAPVADRTMPSWSPDG